jgi:hypothetical protein
MSGNSLTCQSIQKYTNSLHSNIIKVINVSIIKEYLPEDYLTLCNMYNAINKIQNKYSPNYLLSINSFNYYKLNIFKKAINIKFNKMTKEQLNTYLLLENSSITNELDPYFNLNTCLDMSEDELDLYLNSL